MSGRVAAVAKQPVFNLMRHRLGLKLGLITLVGSLISTLITCAAEVGGMALILQLPDRLALSADGGGQRRRSDGFDVGPAVQMDRADLRPARPHDDRFRGGAGRDPPAVGASRGGFRSAGAARASAPSELLTYLLFRRRDPQRRAVPVRSLFLFVGRNRGGLGPQGPADQPRDLHRRLWRSAHCCAISILADVGPAVRPAHVGPQIPGTAALEAAIPFGKPGCCSRLLGMLFAVAGAAVETCMANAYSVAQFFGWEWGRHKKPWEAPRFTIAWIAVMLLALLIVLTGVDVMSLVEYAVLFSIIVLPLTYLPLMLLANDKSYMREYANKWLAKGLGWLFFAIVTAAAIAAIPLYLLTSGGQG